MESVDHEMYRAAIHGDLEAFELVIRKMSRPLFAIAFGALQNRDEAEDVVQDAFVKAWKARWQVRNRAHDILMRRRKRVDVERAHDWCCAGFSGAMGHRAGRCHRHRPRHPPVPPPSRELGTRACGLCAKWTFCPLFHLLRQRSATPLGAQT